MSSAAEAVASLPSSTSGDRIDGMSRSVAFGILGGLVWFVAGLLIGPYVWT